VFRPLRAYLSRRRGQTPCDVCGRGVEAFAVHPDLWRIGIGQTSGQFCFRCFCRTVEARGLVASFTLQVAGGAYKAWKAAGAFRDIVTMDERGVLRVHGKAIADLVPYTAILRKDPCVYCGEVAGTIDHIVPQGSGGPDTIDNLTAACRNCNLRKGSRPLWKFLIALQRHEAAEWARKANRMTRPVSWDFDGLFARSIRRRQAPTELRTPIRSLVAEAKNLRVSVV
jgi:hypothetical protein